jgi:signal transduction histidine kinase
MRRDLAASSNLKPAALKTVRVLLVEDSPSDAHLLQEALHDSCPGQFEITLADRWSEADRTLTHARFDVVLLDLSLPDSSGQNTVLRAQAKASGLPIIILTAHPDEVTALHALREGVQDYLVKGQFDGAQTARAIRYAIERKRQEEALNKAKQELASANLKLEQLVQERTAKLRDLVGELEHFAYSITHDMRAPLRAMRGFGEVIMESCSDCTHAESKALLRRIITAADRMDCLIRDALRYNLALQNDVTLEPVDVGALLQGMLESYPEFEPVRASIRVQPAMPWVLGNQAGLTQCFSNLLSNAIKFVRPGQPPDVQVRAEPRDGWVRLWFEDQGVGIPESFLPKVFEVFSRGHHSYEGTGIGLALVRKVISKMGGKVGVLSKEGHGSRFWLDLRPVGRGSADSSQAS